MAQPVWLHKLRIADLFHNEAYTTAERGALIVARIKKASWYDEFDFSLECCLEGLADLGDLTQSEAVVEFDGYWDEFYDWCDRNRVWVETRSSSPAQPVVAAQS